MALKRNRKTGPRRRNGALDPRNCKHCTRLFQPTRKDHEFCTPDCRKEHHRYGALTSKVVAALAEKQMRRVLAAELATVLAGLARLTEQVNTLTRRLAEIENTNPPAPRLPPPDARPAAPSSPPAPAPGLAVGRRFLTVASAGKAARS